MRPSFGDSSGNELEASVLFGLLGFTWCEALSPGVPKRSAQLRDNLWSEVSFLHRFRLARENGETFRDNLWWPISSKPEKGYSSIPASAATAPTRDQVTQRRLHDCPRAESCAQQQTSTRASLEDKSRGCGTSHCVLIL